MAGLSGVEEVEGVKVESLDEREKKLVALLGKQMDLIRSPYFASGFRAAFVSVASKIWWRTARNFALLDFFAHSSSLI